LGRDPPADMPSLKIIVKPGTVSAIYIARRYLLKHQEIMAIHMKVLMETGLCYRNPRSKKCSHPFITKR